MRKVSIGELRLLTDIYGEEFVLAHPRTHELVRSVYDALNSQELSIIRDLYIKDHPMKEVALQMNVPYSTIHNRKVQIFSRLRRSILPKEDK